MLMMVLLLPGGVLGVTPGIRALGPVSPPVHSSPTRPLAT
jgi:hypothetical protein